ncbi:hypothetical protein MRS44_017944 [Fusarium solani]|uniref:uncharacterized protein n=1 Tax=Fusarium solani TaxID=169388 RepID=UPI0032C40134|nr:hypothetical protein MRS44_017944 [Fusarium solani]
MSLSKVARENDIAEVLRRNQNGEKLRSLATLYDLDEGMLRGRKKGAKDARTAQIGAQKLSPLQEAVLANYLLEEEAAGRGLSRRDIREIAQEILDPESEDITIGKNWPSRFLERNPDIKLKPSTPIEAARAKEATPERIRRFSTDLETQIEEKNVPPDRIYNMDEHGLTEGKTKAGKVFGDAFSRRSFVSQSDNRTWVSVLEAANAVGRRIKPCVVFTGINFQQQWFPENPPDWAYDCSATGWSNARICEKRLKEVFIPETRPSRVDSWRILVLDGFDGHISPRFRFRAAFHRIQLVYLNPPPIHLISRSRLT